MSKNYWTERFTKEEEVINDLSKEQIKRTCKEYDKSLRKINDKIYGWYAKYAKDNRISFSEAKKQLTLREKEELKMTLEEYIEKGESLNINPDAKVLKELKNASTRVHIDRLESLKQEIKGEVHLLTKRVEDMTGKHLGDVFEESYYKSMYGVQKGLREFQNINKLSFDVIDGFIHKPWTSDKKNWSKRLWGHDDRIANMLHQGLTQNIVAGRPLDSVINDVAKRFKTEKTIAGRLVMTESAAYHERAKEQCYKDLDIEQYEIIATLDNHTSSICREMDKKIFSMKDYQVGVTAPPFHVFCRSTTAPYFADDINSKRASRNSKGEYKKVDDMSYEEWKQGFVKKKPINLEPKEKRPAKVLKTIENKGIIKGETYEWKFKKLLNDEDTKHYFYNAEGYKEWSNKLTQEELKSIDKYTSNGYKEINKYNRKLEEWAKDGDYTKVIEEALELRKTAGPKPIQGKDEPFMAFRKRLNAWIPSKHRKALESYEAVVPNNKILDQVISRYELKDDVILFRGVRKDALPKFDDIKDLVGQAYTDSSFMSTSPIRRSSWEKEVMLELRVKKGKGKGAFLEEYTSVPNELEFLLARNTEFKILKAEQRGEQIHVIMEMI